MHNYKNVFDTRRGFKEVINSFRNQYPSFFKDYHYDPLRSTIRDRCHSNYEKDILTKPLPDKRVCEILTKPKPDEGDGERQAEETMDQIEKLGFEAVAVYAPYHLYDNWGIWVFLEKLNGKAYLVSRGLKMDFKDAFIGCEKAVIEHEYFHFRTEYSATVIESITEEPTYLPYFRASLPYNKNEEAIANACGLTLKSPYVRQIRKELEKICQRSPPGYRDYNNYIKGGVLDVNKVRMFWAEKFLQTNKPVFLPLRPELATRLLVPVYYVQIKRTP
jgi:hypothetical protein